MADAPGSSRPDEPLHVLLVEDNPGDARLFEEHLTDSDLEAGLTWEEGLEEGLERLAEARPDVLVLDLGLPDSEGTEAVRRCREAAPSVPVVVLTGQKGEEVARRVQEAGATEYLQKEELMPALLARTLRWAVRTKAMEKRMGRQRAWIESIAENITGGLFRATPDEGIQYANEALVSTFRYDDAEALLGADPKSLYAEPGRRDELIGQLGENGTLENVEARFQRADGSTFVGLLNARAVPGEGGAIKYIDGVVTDITDRKEVERKRRQVVRRVTDAIVEVDSEWQFTLVNQQAENLYNADEEDLLGKDFWKVFAEARGTRFEEEYRQVMQTREPTRFEEYYSGLDGWFDVQVYPNDDGGLAFYFEEVTERKEREEALQDERNRYATLFESLPTPVVQYQPRGDGAFVKRVNPAFEETFGAEASALEGEDLNDFFVPEGEAEEAAALDRRALQEGPQRAEVRRKAAGEVRDFRVDLAGREQDEGPPEAYAIYTDITDRKRREQELRRTTARLTALYDHSPDMINVHDPEGTIIDPNPRLLEKTGYDREELEGMKVWEIDERMTPDRAEALWEEMQTGDRVELEGAYRRKDGSVFPVEVHVRKLDLEGEPRFMAISHDVTEQKRREEQLLQAKKEAEEAETLFETIFENVPVMIEILDFETGYRRVNDHLEEILGWTSEELREHPNTTELLYSTREEVKRARTLVKEAPEGWHELRPLTKSGEALDTLWTIAEVPGERRLAIGLDITERKRRERALERAKEEAERMSRLKSAFLANMSHEIRTPLTSILGFAEAIGEAADPEAEGTVAEFSHLIEKSGRRLMDTLDGVLNLSKLEAGEMDLTAEPVDLAAEAEESAEQFRPQAEDEGIALQVETGGGPVWARADKSALQIVLRNLLSNAIKYTEEGGAVRVRAYREPEAAVLEVEDTGIGMEPGEVETLFDAFAQESEGRARAYEGTGLGLAIAKKAVEKMGGSIGVDTEKGVGSCFTVRLQPAEGATSAEAEDL